MPPHFCSFPLPPRFTDLAPSLDGIEPRKPKFGLGAGQAWPFWLSEGSRAWSLDRQGGVVLAILKQRYWIPYPTKYPTIYSAHLPNSVNYLGHFWKKSSSHVHCPWYRRNDERTKYGLLFTLCSEIPFIVSRIFHRFLSSLFRQIAPTNFLSFCQTARIVQNSTQPFFAIFKRIVMPEWRRRILTK